MRHTGAGWEITTGPRFDPVDGAATARPAPDGPAWRTEHGDPVGPVELSHAALGAAVRGTAERLGLPADPGADDADDLVVVMAGTVPPDPADLLVGLVAGRRLVLADGPPPAGPGGAVVVADPGTWRGLLAGGWSAPEGTRLVCRGAALAPDLMALLARTGPPVLAGRTTPFAAVPVGLDPPGQVAGPALLGVTRTLLDRTGAPAAAGTVGELHLAGPAVASRPGEATGPHGLPTGELHRRTATGGLAFVGHADGRLAVGDHVVTPARIEQVLTAVDGVRAAAVVAGEAGTGIVARLVPDGNGPDPVDLARTVRARAAADLAPHEVPAGLGLLPELPRLADGSVDRPALAALGGAGLIGAEDTTEPRDRRDRAVAAIFREVLPGTDFGVHSDFFALGGRSLLAAKVIGRVRDELGLLVPVRAFFRRPTVAGLAAELAAAEESRTGRADRSAALQDQLAGLSDAEVRHLLEQLDRPHDPSDTDAREA